ncbi:MAG TPA: helix-turn-helix domain-containing protein [Scandinavium sp.]|jgi:hypothetical protein|uniref:helix-turn-helix domain-containing protein n=1 Tax=Scandinavium sp. TaxID=2830653 RepID=UPI002E35DE57|nr:helix-turn-helix domain-containing protein [Scandinavium sp.]HEX4502383.1 helix-turn-helix domain-containing protein [Scandinavium sp.]
MPAYNKPIICNVETKPNESIRLLLDELVPYAVQVNCEDKTPLPFVLNGEIQCYLLVEGFARINRKKDNLTVSTEQAPFIFGFSMSSNDISELSIHSYVDTVLYQLPLDIVNEIIEKKTLWKPLAYLLTYLSSRIFSHCTRTSQFGSYQTIRVLLHELYRELDHSPHQETVMHYIKSRSLLSRSGIMQIISELKKGDYIEIENGKLKAIKCLPERF